MEKDNKYSRGKIYKIVSPSHPELVYYGSTCNELYKRFYCHKQLTFNSTQSKLIMCYDDAKIILVESYPCNNRNELEAKEFEYITNNECVNKCGKGRDIENQKEYRKEYYTIHKESHNNKMKQYYEEHKEEYSKKWKQYYEEHKEELIENKKEYLKKHYEEHKKLIICECGKTITQHNLKQHKETKFHKEFESNKLKSME